MRMQKDASGLGETAIEMKAELHPASCLQAVETTPRSGTALSAKTPDAQQIREWRLQALRRESEIQQRLNASPQLRTPERTAWAEYRASEAQKAADWERKKRVIEEERARSKEAAKQAREREVLAARQKAEAEAKQLREWKLQAVEREAVRNDETRVAEREQRRLQAIKSRREEERRVQAGLVPTSPRRKTIFSQCLRLSCGSVLL